MRRLSLLPALLLLLLCGCGRAAGMGRPEAAAPVATAAVADPARQAALDYFSEIAFGSEYGIADKRIRKWTVPIRAAVHGKPTDEDMAAIQRVMDGMNAVKGFPGISLVDESPNMDIHFVPLEEMDKTVSGYVEGNWGFFTVRYGAGGIRESCVAIASDATDQQARNHLLFEEIIQSAGLMRDSDRYADSIFYGQWTTVQQPDEMDWELMGMLYLPQIKTGMGMEQAMDLLEQYEKTAPGSSNAPAS